MLLFSRLFPMIKGHTLPDARADYAQAQKIGFYRLSDHALYCPDGGYLLRRDITQAIRGTGSAHVTGCCAGGVPVPRVVAVTAEKKFPLLFDTEKAAIRLEEALNGEKN